MISTCLFTLISATANAACPKGTTLQGGSGPHHHGAKCVAIPSKKAPPSQHNHAATKAAPHTEPHRS